jgi:site-specific DNA-methyltransferase (adenine-specific)
MSKINRKKLEEWEPKSKSQVRRKAHMMEAVGAAPYMPTKAKTSEWETPPEIFDPLNEEFNFQLDAAASKENTKCLCYSTDGINEPWGSGPVWLNPPYDAKNLAKFTLKALRETQENGTTVVMLVPAKTDQPWWHLLWANKDVDPVSIEYRWIRGRVRFVGARHSAPFPSVVIVIKSTKPTEFGTYC